MYTLLVILVVVLAVLMCLIVMIQESKGGGLASSFSASNQIMGVRKTTDVIEKKEAAIIIPADRLKLLSMNDLFIFFINNTIVIAHSTKLIWCH